MGGETVVIVVTTFVLRRMAEHIDMDTLGSKEVIK